METQEDRKMSLVGHLQELRKRIVWVLIVFIMALVVGFIYAQPLVRYMMNSPAAKDIVLNALAVSDGIRVYLQFAFLIALTVTLPFALFQVWRFVAPGLNKKERRSTAWFIPTAFVLFIAGISFAYFVIFPMIIKFLTSISNELELNEMYGISQYFGFMFNMIIPFGILFELPIVVIFLTRLGILSPRILKKFRKIAYLILVIIAASITPPDLVSEVLVSLPLILLYEFSVWLSKITAYRKEKRLKKANESLEDDKMDEQTDEEIND